MKRIKTYVASLLFIVCSFALVPAHAQYTGYYLEAAGGPTDVDFLDFDDDGSFGRLSVGYRFNDNISVEVSYYDYGDYRSDYEQQLFQVDDQGNIISQDFYPGSLDYTPTAFGLGLTGGLPLGRHFQVYAKAGFTQWDMEIEQEQTFPPGLVARRSFDETGTGIYFGAGVGLNIGLRFSIRAEYEVQDWSTSAFTDNAKVKTSAIGLRWYF